MVASPDEDGSVALVSSCQSVDNVQVSVAGVLALPQHKVRVKVRRVGGGFGGKIAHNIRIASSAALGAMKTGQQVRFAVDRNSDFAMFGGRCDTRATYDFGYDDTGKIHAIDMTVNCLGGAWLESNWFELFGMISHVESVYDIPAVRVQFLLLRANVPPRTAVRAPGEPQAQLLMENIIEHVASLVGLPPHVVRERNMLVLTPGGGDGVTALGKKVRADLYTMPRIWEELKASSGFEARLAEVAAFNAENRWRKRGLSLVPSKYCLSPATRTAAVTIYPDGTVSIAHPGVEMGQGLITKVHQTAAYCLTQALPPGSPPIDVGMFRSADSSTVTLAFQSFTGGSTTSESACEAVRAACEELVSRMAAVDREKLGASYGWTQLVAASVGPMCGAPGPIKLIATATGGPRRLDDGEGGTGYETYGAALAVAEVDVLTGDRRVLSVDLLYDTGKTLNPAIDIGQTEGAFVFGIGNLMSEAVGVEPETGLSSTASTWKYAVPGVFDLPESFRVSLLRDSPLHAKGPISSKAVGEPPMMLASSVLLALQAACAEAAAGRAYRPLCAPATAEAVKAAVGYASVREQLLEKE
ncbi:hypothetical protein FOA52_014372 [Chlamydomonas sp. UWO 241]|nr:hypothetical protein FOA52_014372 [Chlamydomonas sp. UWO 241]